MNGDLEAVLFDIDGTLCRYERSTDELLSIAFERAGVEPLFTADEYMARFADIVDGSEGEVEGVRDLRSRCFGTLARDAGREASIGRAVAREYAAERDHSRVRFTDGARSALEYACDRYRVGVVTNGSPDMQATKLEALGIADRFETVVHGGYDAPAKPNPDPFHDALGVVGADPGRTVHVGDSLSADVAGAHAAGVRSAWLDRDGLETPDPEPHYRLESMRDLLEEPWH